MAKAGDFFGVITAAVSDRRLIVGLDGLRPGSLAAVFGAVFGSAGVREALLAGAAAVPLVSGTLRGLVEVRIVGDPPDRLIKYFCCFSQALLQHLQHSCLECSKAWWGRGAVGEREEAAEQGCEAGAPISSAAIEDRDRTRRALATRALARGRSGLRKPPRP